MALKYRDMPFRNQPAEGRRLPAFVFAEYGQGDVLLFSHGTFDIWCVYHGIPVDTMGSNEGDPYPLTLDTVVIESKIPRRLHFKGRLTKHSLGPYNFSAPKDVDYFGDMRRMAETYGAKRVWSSFMRLYNSIPQKFGVSISRKMTKTAASIADGYPQEPDFRFTLDCLLCAMIAENNRTTPYRAILGKKVKALGAHRTIFDDKMSLEEIANYSKGVGWRDLDAECKRRHIITKSLA